jgi:hypothetical protein
MVYAISKSVIDNAPFRRKFQIKCHSFKLVFTYIPLYSI